MSITFTISGERANWETAGEEPNFANFANQNARELLEWLGFEVDPTEPDIYGALLPGDLARRCERRLASTPDNVATDLPRAAHTFRSRDGGPTVIQCGSPAGRKADRARLLLALAKRAGDRLIQYG